MSETRQAFLEYLRRTHESGSAEAGAKVLKEHNENGSAEAEADEKCLGKSGALKRPASALKRPASYKSPAGADDEHDSGSDMSIDDLMHDLFGSSPSYSESD